MQTPQDNNTSAALDAGEAVQFIKRHFPAWSNVPEDSVSFQRLTGLTNKTYKVDTNHPAATTSADGKPPVSTLFLRVFEKDGVFFDRSKEMNVMEQLHRHGIGPALYGAEGRYRLEEFFVGSRTMRTSELLTESKWRKKVAQTLAKFHGIKPETVEKVPLLEKAYREGEVLREFKEKVDKLTAAGKFSEEELEIIAEISRLTTEDEQKFLNTLLSKQNRRNLVFSHNDLLCGNILVLEPPQDDLVFIDYEYAAYNYRGYDFANHLNESQIDYSISEAPFFQIREENGLSAAQLSEMIFHYVVFSHARALGLDGQQIEGMLSENSNDQQSLIRAELEANEFVRRECRELMEEVRACQMMSHAYWILWSVVMCKNEAFQFEHIKYAYERFKIYENLKRDWQAVKGDVTV